MTSTTPLRRSAGRAPQRHAPPPTPSAALDPQLIVTYAALATCHRPADLHCGLSVVLDGGAPETVAATDDLAVRLDWLQQELRQGPSLAPGSPELVVSSDLADDARWPDFGRLCVASLDLRSLVALRMPLGTGDWATLILAARRPETIEHLDVHAVRRLVPLATASARALVQTLGGALRAAGGQGVGRVALASGLVAAGRRVTPHEAFRRLLRASHDSDRSLVEVALDELRCASPGLSVGGPGMWRESFA